MSLRRSLLLPSAAALGASALLLVACSGKVLSLGTNSTQSALVSPNDVSGTPGACDANTAHPNVCCTAGPNEPASCVDYPSAPFTPCADGATTYPDPRTCCALDGSGACTAAPGSSGGTPASSSSSSGGTIGSSSSSSGGNPTSSSSSSGGNPTSSSSSSGGGSSGGGTCGANVCPPGWYTPANASGNECCQTDASGATSCTASSGGCACPSCAPGQPCPPCDCGSPTPTPACPACPPGWQVPQGDPSLCCTTDASGVIECFSQAGVSGGGGGPEPIDAGPGPNPGGTCFGSASTDGAVGQCGCSEQSGGHSYEVDCDPATSLCSCVEDNGAPTASFPYDGHDCSDPTTLFTTCGFPQ
jgi:hypothetical protein